MNLSNIDFDIEWLKVHGANAQVHSVYNEPYTIKNRLGWAVKRPLTGDFTFGRTLAKVEVDFPESNSQVKTIS